VQTVTLRTNVGGERELPVTLNLKAFKLSEGQWGGFARSIDGTLAADELGVYGSFTADYCYLLDFICV
jgi:hypothetical protein